MASITIKDIAAALHFSVSTVSRALQNHPDISEETKRIIVAYAREHRYRPNQLASSLRTQKVTTIGVLLPDVTNYFFSTILAGVEKVANQAGYTVLIARTKEDPERERESLRMLANSRVAGIVACPTKRTVDFSPYTELVDQDIPLVIVDRYSPVYCDQVISDDYGGAYQAVEYLIQTGCKRIMMFTSPFPTSPVLERQRGYWAALKHYNLPYSDALLRFTAGREEAISEASKLFSEDLKPDAVFCVNDQISMAVAYMARQMHIRVPEDLSICGFSNDVTTIYTEPMQTTVEQHGHRIGRRAMERLLLRLDPSASPSSAPPSSSQATSDAPSAQAPETIVIPTGLLVRETTK